MKRWVNKDRIVILPDRCPYAFYPAIHSGTDICCLMHFHFCVGCIFGAFPESFTSYCFPSARSVLMRFHAGGTAACHWIENNHRSCSSVPSGDSSHIFGVQTPTENSKHSREESESTSSTRISVHLVWHKRDRLMESTMKSTRELRKECLSISKSINVLLPCTSCRSLFETSSPWYNVLPAGKRSGRQGFRCDGSWRFKRASKNRVALNTELRS